MNNLARLRELADNYKRSIGTSSYDEAKQLYESAAHEMLPGLIAVAEKAGKIPLYDYSSNDSDFVYDCDKIKSALAELEGVRL